MRVWLSGLCAALLIAAQAGEDRAAAQGADGLNHKQIRLQIPTPAGSGYDVFGRLLARHLGRHLPGAPAIIAENVPGAGGVTMMNSFYNSAPRDGSVIAIVSKNLLLDPLFGNDQARYDVLKTNWLGSAVNDNGLCFTWKERGIDTIEKAKSREVLVGSTGRTAETFFIPQLLNEFLGTKFKVVLGYPDSGAVGLAMERGEIDGACGFSIGTIKSAKPDWLDKHQITIMLQVAFERSPELPDVPSLDDYVKDGEPRQALELAFGVAPMSRPVAAPPGVSSDRVAQLRAAFDATLGDAAFLGEARKSKIEIEPLTGDAAQKLLSRLYATPKAVVQKVIEIRDKQ